MSKIVTTEFGRFRMVDDHGSKSFLFECPTCKEWLPMSEEHLNGSVAPVHLSRPKPASKMEEMSAFPYSNVCPYAERKRYGATLVATMQARS